MVVVGIDGGFVLTCLLSLQMVLSQLVPNQSRGHLEGGGEWSGRGGNGWMGKEEEGKKRE